jgi:O-antigen ligase
MSDSQFLSGGERGRFALPYAALPRARRFRRDWPLALGLSAAAFYLTFRAVLPNMHTPAGVTETEAVRTIVSAVPLMAAALAALAIFRPWPAFLAILLLTPVWDAGQVSWNVGDFQVILQTVFVIALGVGCLVSRDRARAAERAELDPDWWVAGDAEPPDRLRRLAAQVTIGRFAGVAVAAFLALAAASTYYSPGLVQSRGVLVHGLVEPIAMGAILIALRPNRTDLALVATALGGSAAMGAVLNVVQTVPGATSLAMLQANRFSFSLLTYGNVGLFGEVLAMAVPLIVGVILARRSLRLGASTLIVLALALAVCSLGLFLTFSKSAWLATSIATTLLVLLAVQGWRSRAAIAVTAALVSSFVLPWPAMVLQYAPPLDSAYRTAMVRVVGASRFDSWNPSTISGQGSVMFRVRAAEAGLHMATDHPVLGVGLNQYRRNYLSGYAIPPTDRRIDHAHSLWPELAAELGFPAMVLAALIYAAALLALWRVYRDPPDSATRLMAAAFMAAIMAWIIVATAFGSDIYRPVRDMSSEVVMMGVVTAAAFALARFSRDQKLRMGPARS